MEALGPLWPVVIGIEARVISRAVDGNPFGAVDAPAVLCCRADGEGARHLNPSPLLHRNSFDLVRRFGEVLVLAEDQRDIVTVFPRHSNRVESQADINAFLLSHENRRGPTARKRDGLVAVPKRTRKGAN